MCAALSSSDRERWVVPFYLAMMGTNAVRQPVDVLEGVVAAAREIEGATVVALLSDGWREAAMGAWFACAQPEDVVAEPLLAALARGFGRHDGAPLVAAATLVVGAAAAPTLDALVERAPTSSDSGLARAAIAHLTGGPPGDDEAMLAGLLAVAARVSGEA